MKVVLIILTAILFVPISIVAHSEQQADETLISETIVTATRAPQLTKNLTGNSAVLDEIVLTRTGHHHIQESLNQLPGVSLHRNNGQEYLPAIRSPVLTGAGACGGFLIMENNIPLRPAGFCNVNELFESHTEQAQRVEVLRGPGTALFGSNAIHGVINILSPASIEEGGQFRLEVGPHDFGRLKLALGNGKTGGALTLTHSNGYRDDASIDQQKLSLRHQSEFDGIAVTSGLTVVNLQQETAGFVVGENGERSAYNSRRLSRQNLNPEAYRNVQSLRVWSELSFENGVTVTPYARYNGMAFLQHFLPGDPLEENVHTSVGLQTNWPLQLTEGLKLIAGFDLEYASGWLKQTQDHPTQGSPFLQETIPVGKHYDYQVDMFSVSPYTHFEWTTNERWLVTVGLRFDHMQYDYDNRILAGRTRDDGTPCGFGGCRYSRPADSNDSFANWSPKLGVRYLINNSHSWFANIGRGFRVPQATELYRLQREQQVADLDSESITSIELGLRGSGEVLRYEVTAYQLRKENVISRDSDFFNVDNGRTSHKGVELSLQYEFSDQWDIAVAASFARHRYDSELVSGGEDVKGKDIDTAPRHFGSATLGWNLNEATRMELQWLHMGKYYTSPENENSYPGHNIFHLRAFKELPKGWSVSARLLNIADQQYAERADYTSFTGNRYMPGEPRSLYLEVSKEW